MIRRLVTLLRQDLTNSLRDSVLVYVAVAPVILAVVVRLFLPSFEQSALTVTALQDTDPEIVRELEAYFLVEVVRDREGLEGRVSRPDDVAGVLVGQGPPEQDALTLVLEGNERAETREAYQAVMEAVLERLEGGGGETSVRFQAVSLGGGRSYLRESAAVLLIMTAALLGGMVVGFNMVDDRHTRAVQALAVSPLPLRDYLVSRAVYSLLQGLLLGLATSMILLGLRIPYARLVLALLASAPVAVIVGFVTALMADNQIAAIGSVKIVMPAYLLVPFASIFVPLRWQWVFFPFPNYWMFLSFRSLFVDTPQAVGFGAAAALAAGSGLALNVLLLPRLRRVFRFRGGGGRIDRQAGGGEPVSAGR